MQRQRAATITAMQDLTRLKRGGGDSELSWSLVLESMRYQLEAEVRWLDHCEGALARAALARPARSPRAAADGDGRSAPTAPASPRPATTDPTGAPR